MGILDSMMAQQQGQMAQPQNTDPAMAQSAVENPQGSGQQGGMAQMYQMVMQNSMNAIADVAQQRIQEKGPMQGVADLIATAMASNLQAAQQNGKTIPPQVMIQVAKDLATQLLQQLGADENQIDDALFDILMAALDQFGEMTHGMLSAEEEQQYVDMIHKMSDLEQQRQTQMQGNQPAAPQGE